MGILKKLVQKAQNVAMSGRFVEFGGVAEKIIPKPVSVSHPVDSRAP